MSRLYFHAEHETAELLGAERAHLNGIIVDLAVGLVPWKPDRLEPYLTPNSDLRCWLRDGKAQVLPRWISTYLTVTDEARPVFQDLDGEPLDAFSLVLNTALIVGSDPVCLMARLHAQCEIHCYVEGPHRAWLAGLIEQGRTTGVMRAGTGWEQVVELLHRADDGPVVCSYSVTERFPNAYIAEWEPDDPGDEEAWEEWGELPDAEQWRLAMAGLRSRPASHLLELRPDTLRAPFGHSRSLIDLFHGPLPAPVNP